MHPTPTSVRGVQTQDDPQEKCPGLSQGLLSIGTLGGGDQTEGTQRGELTDDQHDLMDFSIEEVKRLQEVLRELIRRKSKSGRRRSNAAEEERANHPLERFLNCPSSLEVDRRVVQKQTDDPSGLEHGDLSPNTKMILIKARDLLINNKNSMKAKSLKFLLKKMFVCGTNFSPAPSLKDPVESRMEKILRAMLHKKMHPSASRPSTSQCRTGYFLENKPRGKPEEEVHEDKPNQWDRTDSDFIVLDL